MTQDPERLAERPDRAAVFANLDERIAEAVAKMPPLCEHDFQGWREFEDGRGGEQFCSKCGMGAMQWSMRMLP